MAVFTLDRGIYVPAGLIDMQMPGGSVAVDDRPRQRASRSQHAANTPGQGALGDVEPVVGQRGDDTVHGAAEHELLVQQPGQEIRGKRPLPIALGYRWCDQDPAEDTPAGPPAGSSSPGTCLAAFSDDVPNASLTSMLTFSVSAPTCPSNSATRVCNTTLSAARRSASARQNSTSLAPPRSPLPMTRTPDHHQLARVQHPSPGGVSP